MKCSFSARFDGLVVTTNWNGQLTLESVVFCMKQRDTWIKNHCRKDPEVFIEDFTNTLMDKISSEDIQFLAYKSESNINNYDSLSWIYIAPRDAAYGMGRVWQAYSDDIIKNSMITRSKEDAEVYLRRKIVGFLDE